MFKLLEMLGYSMEIMVCVHCRGGLKSGTNGFSFLEGGVLCGNCLSVCVRAFPVSDEAIKTVRIFRCNSLRNIFKLHIPKKVASELKRMELDCLWSLE